MDRIKSVLPAKVQDSVFGWSVVRGTVGCCRDVRRWESASMPWRGVLTCRRVSGAEGFERLSSDEADAVAFEHRLTPGMHFVRR
jgi:hypothetical protein